MMSVLQLDAASSAVIAFLSSYFFIISFWILFLRKMSPLVYGNVHISVIRMEQVSKFSCTSCIFINLLTSNF
jgi:hypothetical protein